MILQQKLSLRSVALIHKLSLLQRISLGLLFGLVYLQVCSCAGGNAPPSVKWNGKGAIYVVHFPGDWYESESIIMVGPGKYEIRTKMQEEKEIFLFKKRIGQITPSSYNQYAISLRPNVSVRSVTAEEWRVGKPTEEHPGIIIGYSRSATSPQSAEYNGIQYLRSGTSWQDKLGELSPDKRWLVVLSYTGEGPYEYGPLLGEVKIQKKGKIYLDIYDTRDGKPGDGASMRINYTYSGGGASIPNTLWVEGRYLVMPIDHDYTSCIFWEIPSR